jgi:hypothetical protein
MTDALVNFSQDDFGMIGYLFTETDGVTGVYPDWDDNLKFELYDSRSNKMFTYTITSDPPLLKGITSGGEPYVYTDEIDLIDYELGVATAKIYANLNGVTWGDAPTELDAFNVVMYQVATYRHPKSWVLKLRRFMRDYPELNRIIKAEETSDRMLREAIRYAFTEWNVTDPIYENITPEYYPYAAENILIQLATSYVLKSVVLLRARNRIMYNDAGFSIDEEAAVLAEEKTLMEYFSNEAKRLMKAYKVTNNVLRGWGEVRSEYASVSYLLDSDYNVIRRVTTL